MSISLQVLGARDNLKHSAVFLIALTAELQINCIKLNTMVKSAFTKNIRKLRTKKNLL